jgi:O-antigen biosynthesis alpha-1,3-abequosyltransferase
VNLPPPLLSICIPTHNRAVYLRELLESIAAQIEPGVQVAISDDACTDDTPAIVDSFRSRLPDLKYSRAEKPLRYDRNILKLVDLADGTFCWLFGDDDRMEPGALRKVLQALQENPSLTGLTVDRIDYDHDLSKQIPTRPAHQTQSIIFDNADQAFLKLLDRLGFLSCQIISREIWSDIVRGGNLEPYFINYVQLYVIARMLVTKPRWMFLAEKSVGFRSDNDSFRALGAFGRLKMDVCGYEKIAGDVFGRDSAVYRRAMSEVATTHARHHIVGAKRAKAPLSFSLRSILLCTKNYWRYPRFWLETFPVLLMPAAPALGLRRLYQKVRRTPSSY